MLAELDDVKISEREDDLIKRENAYNRYIKQLSDDQRITFDDLIPFVGREFEKAGFDLLLGDDIIVQNAFLMAKYGDKYNYESMMKNVSFMFSKALRDEDPKVTTRRLELDIEG